MQPNAAEITNTIIEVAHKIMRELPEDERRTVGSSSNLLGADSIFDSLNFVTFILDLEETIRKTSSSIALADERAMSQTTNPFQTVATLTSYISMLLAEKA